MTREKKKTDPVDAMVTFYRAYREAKKEVDQPSVLMNALVSLLGGELILMHEQAVELDVPDAVEAATAAMSVFQGGPLRTFIDQIERIDKGGPVFEKVHIRCLDEIDGSVVFNAEVDEDGNLKKDVGLHKDMVH